MSVGTAVVATDIAAHREICGEAALLVEPDRPVTWADAVAAVLDDDALRSELGRRGRVRAPRFDWKTMSTALLELYRRLV
jgi:glycosyltransferase involved in cell wall biosynthesis